MAQWEQVQLDLSRGGPAGLEEGMGFIELSGYLKDVVPVCRARGDSFKLKAIQALAFVLWKQQSLQEAVTLFHEMEELMGGG